MRWLFFITSQNSQLVSSLYIKTLSIELLSLSEIFSLLCFSCIILGKWCLEHIKLLLTYFHWSLDYIPANESCARRNCVSSYISCYIIIKRSVCWENLVKVNYLIISCFCHPVEEWIIIRNNLKENSNRSIITKATLTHLEGILKS